MKAAKVTGDVVPFLMKMPGPTELDAEESGISPAGRQQLRTRFP